MTRCQRPHSNKFALDFDVDEPASTKQLIRFTVLQFLINATAVAVCVLLRSARDLHFLLSPMPNAVDIK